VKFVLFVEGHTESWRFLHSSSGGSIRNSARRVGITPSVSRAGRTTVEIAKKVRLHLSGPTGKDVIEQSASSTSTDPLSIHLTSRARADRVKWAKKHFEDQVGNERFAQHFAVHEIEAWLALPTH